jgi:hypothetical protein
METLPVSDPSKVSNPTTAFPLRVIELFDASTFMFPPVYNAPVIPTPPLTRNAPVVVEVEAVPLVMSTFNTLSVFETYDIALAFIALVPFPNKTAFVVRLVAPVPPYATPIVAPFHVPDVIVPVIDKFVPTFNVPPIPTPPETTRAPVDELVDACELYN